MNKITNFTTILLKRTAPILVAVLILVGLFSLTQPAQAASVPVLASLPSVTCTEAAGVRTCELWAKAGTLILPGAVSVPIYGYADSALDAAMLPGPVLVAIEGETLEIILHNDLAEDTSLSLPGMDVKPDLVGATPGTHTTYTFTLIKPGTYLYEAGMTANGSRQVAMGLYGVLVVRPATHANWAYNDLTTQFDDEVVLVYSEIDPAFNADPSGFLLPAFKAKYFLINGKSYPETDLISTNPGHVVLLRQVNAGLEDRSIGVLGATQKVIANDSLLLPFGYMTSAESLPAGQVYDTLVTIPIGTPSEGKLPLYNTGMYLRNSTQSYGGMLTFLTVPPSLPGPDTTGPLAGGVSANPGITTGTVDVALTAVISDVSTGDADITAAEYFIDTLGAANTGTAMSLTGTGSVKTADATILAAAVNALPEGEHYLYVRGKDANNNWGVVNSAILAVIKNGPSTSGIVITPNPSNGAVAVAIRATGTASNVAPITVTGGEYFIDAPGANSSGTPMPSNITAPIASIDATLLAVDVNALSEGPHTLYIHAQDSLGLWGPFDTASLNIDKTGPLASAVDATPNPVDIPNVIGFEGVRLTATADDSTGLTVSNVTHIEAFIDVIKPNGQGFPLIPSDGMYDESIEAGYAIIPVPTLTILAQGDHTIYIHAKDSSGNWGSFSTFTLTVNKNLLDLAGPLPEIVFMSPNPTNGAGMVMLTGTAVDPNYLSNIALVEVKTPGDNPGQGILIANPAAGYAYNTVTVLPFTVSFPVDNFALGEYVIEIRAQDSLGNWGPTQYYVLNIGYSLFLPSVSR